MQRCWSLATLWTTVFAASLSAAEPWYQWRGPSGDGQVADNAPPVEFSEADVAWKTPLPGRGQSTPVIWDDQIYLTSYLDAGKQRMVFAVDRASGKVVWQEIAWTGTPEPSHQMNAWASASCTTDGERVYAFFGRGGGLFCYSKSGKQLWNRPLGDFNGPWGTAASPVLFEDLVIQNCDSEANASLTAFDKLTGSTVWSTPREDFRGWNTPFLWHVAGAPELIVNGQTGVRSYDPLSGKELWFCSSVNGRGEPAVTPDPDGRLIVVNGLKGALYAVEGGGRGDVSQSKRLWQTPRMTGRDLPSPAVVGHRALVMAMRGGILTCYDTTTGEQVWEERVGGNYAASPVVVGHRALFVSEEGEVVVVDPLAKSPVVARNRIGAGGDEIFRASLAADNGQWLLRSDRMLYAIGK